MKDQTINVESERITVRTKYTGQHLRVTLVNVPDDRDISLYRFRDENTLAFIGTEPLAVQAELVIEAGTRVTIGVNGVTVEPIA